MNSGEPVRLQDTPSNLSYLGFTRFAVGLLQLGEALSFLRVRHLSIPLQGRKKKDIHEKGLYLHRDAHACHANNMAR